MGILLYLYTFVYIEYKKIIRLRLYSFIFKDLKIKIELYIITTPSQSFKNL